MRDDFDAVVADRFKVLDDVPVPDTWSRVLDRVPVRDTRSRVPFSDEALTMIDLETPVPTEPRRQGPIGSGSPRSWRPPPWLRSSSWRPATTTPRTQPTNRPRP